MLRSILVSVEFKITSYTRLASDLKENHLHAIISGFYVGNTPGVGTFYDFRRRLWLSSDKNLTNAVHPLKVKPQKPNGKEEKAPSVEKLTVDDLFRQFEENPPADMAPCAKLWEIFNTFFLQNSARMKLISLAKYVVLSIILCYTHFSNLPFSILISLLTSSSIPDNGTQFLICTRKGGVRYVVRSIIADG